MSKAGTTNEDPNPETAADGLGGASSAGKDPKTGEDKGKEALGDQVQPATQLREDDGNRSFANPVVDPGPVSAHVKHPDRSKDETTIGQANDPKDIMQYQHDKFKPGKVVKSTMAPDLLVGGEASDIYNKESGEGLTDMAVKRAGEPREMAIKPKE